MGEQLALWTIDHLIEKRDKKDYYLHRFLNDKASSDLMWRVLKGEMSGVAPLCQILQ